MAAAPSLQEHVDALAASGSHHVLIDLADLTFCDSAGLNALIRGDPHCATPGGRLRLTGAADTWPGCSS